MSDRIFIGICVIVLIAVLFGIVWLMVAPNDGHGMKAIVNLPGYNAPVIFRLKSWNKTGTMYKLTSMDGTVYRADQKNVLLVTDGGE